MRAKLEPREILAITVAAVVISVTSCTVGPDYNTPRAKLASAWSAPLERTNTRADGGELFWWRSLEDPVLNELIEAAFENNPSLQIAGVRVLGTRARLSQTIGNLFPQQQVISGNAGYSRVNVPAVDQDYVSAQLMASATWEIDFWGKYRRAIESDRASYLASIADYENALVTLVADLANAYVSMRIAEERQRVARTNVITQRESLRIATAQFKAGESGQRDVEQATAQLHQTESALPLLEQSVRQSKNAIALLLGEPPDQVDQRLSPPGRLPLVRGEVSIGIPRDLLRRRADVRSAGLAAAAYSALIGVAKAQMYPAFSLAGEFGVAADNQGGNSLTDMFSWQSRAAKAGAGLVFPVFNYGRLVNQVRVQDAQFQAAVLNYQNTVLSAQREVEDALAAFVYQREAAVSLRHAADAASRSVRLALIQYKAGETDYTTVLTAQQSQLSLQDSVANTEGQVVLALISLYRALGGGWELRGSRDVISDEVKQQMSQRTDWGKLLQPERHLPPVRSEERPGERDR